jgi:hypothetical protein
LRNARRTERVPPGKQPTAGVDWHAAADLGIPRVNEPTSFSWRTKAQRFVADDLGDRKAIVHFCNIYVVRPKACPLVCSRCSSRNEVGRMTVAFGEVNIRNQSFPDDSHRTTPADLSQKPS